MKKNPNSEKRVCIVGAGLVGSLLAIYLSNRGFKIDIFEKRYDIRLKNITQNRTIAMSISDRGIKALKGVGLDGIVLKHSIPKHSRMVHKIDNKRTSQQYGRNQTINTVDRCKLNSILLDKAEKSENIQIHFRTEFVEMDPDNGLIKIIDIQNNNSYT
ncbi:MAG: FAD-dependent monooxygenase [Cyclobacteriaceae bacterium]|nr:FAD-dependent monooxygenase [Cyclobacteriaceae bacterium]